MRDLAYHAAARRLKAAEPAFRRDDPLWYKDAVIYQLHVKAFADSNGDGIGDFPGLIGKLDYLQGLGVTTLWLLPFYPSPLRDDGYDIADYRSINPAYGTMRDFSRFVRECHDRNLRVITELVINHTSDQHPWFQRARRARPGSAHRDYYVWSDSDQNYQGTRIIFLDTEKSNWTWDPVANAYFWHRFYSHQPDLNFDNPRLLKEIVSVLHFWLEHGVDGLRLDAVPYLVEREGTNNENLPETHAILRQIRAEVDAHFADRMLLAEANQWPEDVQEYFGRGDECHMAFHFPLMPRIYMAMAQEDRHPITDIMRQTPDIPESCQWAIFLRNHDELTLEMVTDQERDYLWNTYATDKRARINLGIRRRLAPLMQNDRRKMEVMNSLLLSMPGTPIVYYGDEIAMGDNIFLGDRDGVRTPMQWSPDRNGGFSRADPQRIYLPPIMDPTYGYAAVNVEAQSQSPSSLLNWMKRMIQVRQSRKVFGRGRLRFLYPGNRKILAYLREYEGESVLCVVNLSRLAQAVELDLSAFKGRVPVELLSRSPFPPIGDLPYLLTLPGYSFYWFVLAEQAALPSWHEPMPEPLPDYVTLIARSGWRDVLSERQRTELQAHALAPFIANQRWFGAKNDRIRGARFVDWAELPGEDKGPGYALPMIELELAGGATQRYHLPLAMSWEDGAASPTGPLRSCMLALVRRGPKLGALYEASAGDAFARALVDGVQKNLDLPAGDGRVELRATPRMADHPVSESKLIRRAGEQSNTSILIDDSMMLKLFRRLNEGAHPEVEMGAYLTAAGYVHTPALLGTIEHVGAGDRTALAVLQAFVRNQGDGWTFTANYLDRELEELLLGIRQAPPPGLEGSGRHDFYVSLASVLGTRLAELHRVLARPSDDPAFAPEPVGAGEVRAWRAAAKAQAEQAFAALRRIVGELAGTTRAEAELLLQREAECLARLERLGAHTKGLVRTRLHGDLHLGQVLLVRNDWFIIDFEGEPAKTLAERRAKHSPLRDVAGMLRSFNYAAWAAVVKLNPAEDPARILRMQGFARQWERRTRESFLGGYRAAIEGCPCWPDDGEAAGGLLDLFVLEKACYEIVYEAANRPGWIGIPVRGVIEILDSYAGGANGAA